MSSSENNQPEARFQFRGKFGVSPPVSPPIEEASHEEIDAFVKSILGLSKEKESE